MQNEILKPVLETDETAIPRYDIVNPDGSVAQQNVELRLKNEVMQHGTPYDEDSVLPAKLATQLGLPTTATPAQALQLLSTKSYDKNETLSNETKTLFGLVTDAVPDDVFNWLGNFNMHYWIRSEKVKSYSLFSTSKTIPYYFTADTTVTYYDSITVDESGNIAGQGEHTVYLSYSDYTNATILYTKYYIESPSKAIYFPDNAGVYRGTYDDGTRYVDVEKHNIIDVRTNFLFANHVILKSQNRNEYPDSGESGNYKYEYIGVPFENIIGCARIETGSYIGSGTFGVDNKNALAFSFVPKAVFISGAIPFVATSGLVYVISSSSSMYACTLTLEGKTIKWYSTYNADRQLNSSGKTYYYVAIG